MASLLKRLFGKKDEPAHPMRDVAALMRPLAEPAIHIVQSDTPSLSWVGGMPALPSGVVWPEHEGKRLDFLARLSLSDLHAAHPIEWLPTNGYLLFFYDIARQTWGFDPRDRGSARVLYVADSAPLHSADDDGAKNLPPALPRYDVGFRKIEVLPSFERACVEALHLSDQESDALCDASDAVFDGKPLHQVGGYPAPVQGDTMELDCQLVTNGLYLGNPEGYKSVVAKELSPGADKWVLLLQFDTDDELDIMWGDAGRIYYWVEKEAARAGDFSNVWLVLQCS